MNRRTASACLLLLALVATCPAGAAVETQVRVARDGDLYLVDAVLIAPVTPAEAWDVLTDFDAMPRYVPNLDASRVTARMGNRLRVEQRGVARWGPLKQPFSMVRDVELEPIEEVRSRSVGGTLHRVRSVTRIAPVRGGTEIRHHLEFALDTWLPEFLIEPFLSHEVREQFESVVEEMLRRRAARTVPAAR